MEAIYIKLERPAILANGTNCQQCGQTFAETYWKVGYVNLDQRAAELCHICKLSAKS